MQCQSGALVERWSLPATPCDAFAQVAHDDFLPFCCDDVEFPTRQSHSDLRNQFLCTRRQSPAILPALSHCLLQGSIATHVLAGVQPDQIHIRHPTGSLYGVGLLRLYCFSLFPVSVLSNPRQWPALLTQDSQAGAQMHKGKHGAVFFEYHCGPCFSTGSETKCPQSLVPEASFTDSCCNSSFGNFDYLEHFGSAFPMPRSPCPPVEPQMTLMEHYARLKSQRRVKTIAQTHEQNMCALASYTPATPHSHASSCFSQAQLPCLAPDNQAHSLDHIHIGVFHSDISNVSSATSPCKDTSMKEIFRHPWVATHLQDLSSCFSAGKAEEHLTHLLDLKRKGRGSVSMSHDSHAPSSSTSTHSASPDLQVVPTPARTHVHMLKEPAALACLMM